MTPWISTQEAAARLGVSISTFKRFCDANDIAVIRTPGGHRRIDQTHFEIASRLMRCNNSRINSQGVEIQEIIQLLLEANHTELIERLWMTAPQKVAMAKLLEETFVPALWQIGDMWYRREIQTAHEKVATATALTVLDGIMCRFPALPASARTFVGASFSNSMDTLASKLITVALFSIDIRGIYLGCNLAPEIIAQAVPIYHAEAIWISHTHVVEVEKTIRDHNLLRELIPQTTRVIIGGGGLSPSVRRQIEGCTYHESIESWLAHEQKAAVK